MKDEEILRGTVEPYIDSLYLESPLLERHRDTATVHLFRVFEDAIRMGAASRLIKGERMQSYLGTRRAHESIPWALRWVWEACDQTGKASLALDWEVYEEAYRFLALGFDYYHLYRCFVLYSRGVFGVSVRADQSKVRFFFRSDAEEVRDAARTLYMIEQDHTPFDKAVSEGRSEDLTVIMTLFPYYLQRAGPSSVSYELPDDILEYFKRFTLTLSRYLRYELPGDWSLGAFLLRDFKDFWNSLLCVCVAHDMAHRLADTSVQTRGGAVESVVMSVTDEVFDRNRTIFPIPLEKWLAVKAMLTYAPTQNYWDPFWQPLVRTADGSLLISPSLILSSSAQRNLIALLSRTAAGRKLYDAVSNKKEAEQLLELEKLFSRKGWRIAKRVPVPRQDGSLLTDVDFLVLDREEPFVLLVHAKWLIYPDHIREVLAKDAEVQAALSTAVMASARVRELGKPWLAQIFGEDLDDSLIPVGSIALSRDFIPSGWVNEESIPAVDMSFLQSVVKDFVGARLSGVYLACKEIDAELQKRFPVRLDVTEIKFGKYVFEVPTVET